jgi:hypothetical protein
VKITTETLTQLAEKVMGVEICELDEPREGIRLGAYEHTRSGNIQRWGVGKWELWEPHIDERQATELLEAAGKRGIIGDWELYSRYNDKQYQLIVWPNSEKPVKRVMDYPLITYADTWPLAAVEALCRCMGIEVKE